MMEAETMAIGETTIAAEPREVTDEEVSHFTENGWVHLESFVDPALAAALLETGQALMQKGKDQDAMKGASLAAWWSSRRRVALDDEAEPFHSFLLSNNLGKAASSLMNRARLTDRVIPVRIGSETLTCKAPAGMPGNDATPFHQDWPGTPFDRRGSVNIWVALNDIPAERGSMRFLSGSHREGPLGRVGRADSSGRLGQAEFNDTTVEYEKLTEIYDWSPPLDLKAGDATAHDGCTVHGGPANTTDDYRWAYIMMFFPDDVLNNGGQSFVVDGLGLEANKHIDHPRLRVLYP
jgi:ectoine hydroxylase-related dioxygenase (phytanoyl-CoA dioxygenase family)